MTGVSVAFGGGMALAAYHGGVLQACLSGGLKPRSFAGASAGAVTCAIFAGSAEGDGLRRLKHFWGSDQEYMPRLTSLSGWMSALGRRVFGQTGQFHLRLPIENLAHFRSIYDLAPMKARLNELVDFDRLNGGPRVCVVATDLRSGDPVIFDTSKGDRLCGEHLLASCGFLPEFAPVEIGGRLLGDGGLSLNVPFDPLLDEAVDLGRPLVVVDLFARDGAAPDSLASAVERKNDLLFGNQTYLRLQAALRDPRPSKLSVHLLSYRNERPEGGAEKPYDYSREATAQRWQAGLLDMRRAIEAGGFSAGGEGLRVVRRKVNG
jgi:NTE family protein